jgi:hypothetical protein
LFIDKNDKNVRIVTVGKRLSADRQASFMSIATREV